MKVLLNVKVPEKNTHVLWEHLLGSVTAFVFMYALLFFGPLFLEAKRSSRHLRDGSETIGGKIIVFFVENPEWQIAISFISVLLYNFWVIHKNRKSDVVKSIVLDDTKVVLTKCNIYFKKELQFEIDQQDFEIAYCDKPTRFNQNRKRLLLSRKTTGEQLAEINPDSWMYNKQKRKLKQLLEMF